MTVRINMTEKIQSPFTAPQSSDVILMKKKKKSRVKNIFIQKVNSSVCHWKRQER